MENRGSQRDQDQKSHAYSGYFQPNRKGVVTRMWKERGGRKKRKENNNKKILHWWMMWFSTALHIDTNEVSFTRRRRTRLYPSSFCVLHPSNCVPCNWLLGWSLEHIFSLSPEKKKKKRSRRSSSLLGNPASSHTHDRSLDGKRSRLKRHTQKNPST